VTMPDYAGLRQYRKARSTGTHVGVYDGVEAGMDTDGGRWQTVCEEHGAICSHETLTLARDHASAPEGWCEACMNGGEWPDVYAPPTHKIFIDRTTGTWGMANDLVIATLPENRVDDMETMSDSQLIEMAYRLEETNQQGEDA